MKSGETIPVPPPGSDGRKKWKPKYNPHGPIGLILMQTHEKARAIDVEVVLHNFGWPTLDILKCPHHKIKPIA